ncbi:hypothetical protein [Bacteroides sp.]|uniref:hypothetical protein n=1 Tax=Bacteroides sp. TaxID=29523 RepID=UPI002618526E|nr:hypothetical protein [Bacteroides sp.]MDD3039571.1 hypothetical protein [Bacteroides sp.]
MTATFSIPVFTPVLETISIFVDGELFDTVPGYQKEYYSNEIATGAVITVGEEGNTRTITTFEADLISRIRIVCQLTADELSDSDIVALVSVARREILLEISQYAYGDELKLITENYYKLPNKFIFDFNCGGTVSPLDLEVFKQTLPIYEFTEKEPVTIINMNARDGWIQLDVEITGSQVLKANYYYTQRDARYDDLINMLSWKIASIYYTAQYTSYDNGTATDASQIKIGDITIKNSTSSGESSSTAFIRDRMNKTEAQFRKVITYFKRGFYRVK